ncbi:replication protein [Photorhabdus kayaii]|uniref:replication protein n=1 Tax=Photorhabdus kayaii TaxID=230088 RepID=UPI0021D4A3CF|nr:replication protein [Photorhabdus kayaii]MCT8353856.1 replication protein [Photorhabdus kayaii]
MNTAEVINFPAPQRREVVKVADVEDGYTRIANELYEELIGANLTRNQAKVAHAVCRKTYGFNKKMDRIADSQIAELTKLPRQKVNKAKNELIAMKVLIKEGQLIGPNKNLSEWEIPECHQNSVIVTKTVTGLSPKKGHTKDTITKDKKDIPPNPHSGLSQIRPVKSKNLKIPYMEIMEAYNEAVGDKLPNAESLNEKRKRAIKKLWGELSHQTVEAATKYFEAFVATAKPFYFGENDSGWRASFDYLLRSDTLTKTREGAL